MGTSYSSSAFNGVTLNSSQFNAYMVRVVEQIMPQVAAQQERTGLFSVVERQSRPVGGFPFPVQTQRESRVLRRGEHLFRSGDRVRQVYRVIGGALKSYIMHRDGDEQIIGFYLPGDLIPCDVLDDGFAALSSVVALDTSSVAREALNGSVAENSITERHVYHSMRQEIFRLARLLYMERSSTEARLARFLLDYSEAQASRGYDRNEFRLPMGRKDMARYIGLVPETVSRIFSRLRDRGILQVENNHIRIIDRVALTAIAVGED